MLTIKIYLSESGSVANLKKDFPVYQDAYQNKLLNVYVPTSILSPDFIVNTDNGERAKEYVSGTAVKIACRYVTRAGLYEATGRDFYMRYLKTLTYQGVEYALFERALPKAFTKNAGTGVSAPQLIVNVVTVDTNVTPAKVTSVTTSQVCYLDVLPSSDKDTDEHIDASFEQETEAELNSIHATLLKKQDQKDPRLNCPESDVAEERTVVNAINNLHSREKATEVATEENTRNISGLRNDVDTLQRKVDEQQAENYVGQISGSELPSNSVLDNFVATTLQRDPKEWDVIYFVLNIPTETDKIYKYTRGKTTWNGYPLPAVQPSSNGVLGLVKGSYSPYTAEYDGEVLVDISAGKVVNIYTRLDNGTYVSLPSSINSIRSELGSIENGDKLVGHAYQSDRDSEGNVISEHYLSKDAGVTNERLIDYALPRTFNDVHFLTASGYSDDPNTTAPLYIQATSSKVGDTQITQVEKTLTTAFELSKKNTSTTTLYFEVSRDTTAYILVTTEAKRDGQGWELLSAVLSPLTEFKADRQTMLVVEGAFSELGKGVVKLSVGDKIRQTIEVRTISSVSTTFTLLMSETYPSNMLLNVGGTIHTASGALGELQEIVMTGTLSDNTLVFTMAQDQILSNNTMYKFDVVMANEGFDVVMPDTVVKVMRGSEEIELVAPTSMPSVDDITYKDVEGSFNIGAMFITLEFIGLVEEKGDGGLRIVTNQDNTNAMKDYIREQDDYFIGRETVIGMSGYIQGTNIYFTLDETISDYEFINSTGYLFDLHLAVSELSGADEYRIFLRDKDGNDIHITNILQPDVNDTITFRHTESVRRFDETTGYRWLFYGHYQAISQGGETLRVLSADVQKGGGGGITREEVEEIADEKIAEYSKTVHPLTNDRSPEAIEEDYNKLDLYLKKNGVLQFVGNADNTSGKVNYGTIELTGVPTEYYQILQSIILLDGRTVYLCNVRGYKIFIVKEDGSVVQHDITYAIAYASDGYTGEARVVNVSNGFLYLTNYGYKIAKINIDDGSYEQLSDPSGVGYGPKLNILIENSEGKSIYPYLNGHTGNFATKFARTQVINGNLQIIEKLTFSYSVRVEAERAGTDTGRVSNGWDFYWFYYKTKQTTNRVSPDVVMFEFPNYERKLVKFYTSNYTSDSIGPLLIDKDGTMYFIAYGTDSTSHFSYRLIKRDTNGNISEVDSDFPFVENMTTCWGRLGNKLIWRLASGSYISSDDLYNIYTAPTLEGDNTFTGKNTFDGRAVFEDNAYFDGVIHSNDTLRVKGELWDNVHSPGEEGQVLTSTGSGVEWRSSGGGGITPTLAFGTNGDGDPTIRLEYEQGGQEVYSAVSLDKDSFEVQNNHLKVKGSVSGKLYTHNVKFALNADGVAWQIWVSLITDDSTLFSSSTLIDYFLGKIPTTYSGLYQFLVNSYGSNASGHFCGLCLDAERGVEALNFRFCNDVSPISVTITKSTAFTSFSDTTYEVGSQTSGGGGGKLYEHNITFVYSSGPVGDQFALNGRFALVLYKSTNTPITENTLKDAIASPYGDSRYVLGGIGYNINGDGIGTYYNIMIFAKHSSNKIAIEGKEIFSQDGTLLLPPIPERVLDTRSLGTLDAQYIIDFIDSVREV